MPFWLTLCLGVVVPFKFFKIGDLKGFLGLFMVQMQQLQKKFNVLDFTYGFGTANTALIYHHGKLMALSEADKPSNAWEEGDEVVLITCRLENPDLDKVNGHQNDKLENFKNELYEMRFNMKSGAASQKQLKQRYVYCTILDSIAKVTGIIKFDLHAEPESGKKELEVGGNILGIYDLGPGRFGSEAIFVPKKPGVSGEEDDGYLIFFVHDENTGLYWLFI